MKQTSYILIDALARTLYNIDAREGEIVLQPVCQEYREIENIAVTPAIVQREADAQGRMILLVINGKTLATNSCFTFYRRKVWNISHFSSITGAMLYHFRGKQTFSAENSATNGKFHGKFHRHMENSMEM